MTKQHLLVPTAAEKLRRRGHGGSSGEQTTACDCNTAADGDIDCGDFVIDDDAIDYDEAAFDKGGVAGGGYLLGLIAFARKFARIIITISMLFCIIFISFYCCSESRTTITALAPPMTPPATTIEVHMRTHAQQAHRSWPTN